MARFYSGFLLFNLFLISLPATVNAQDFYVNPDTGSNGNDGSSPTQAWKTITFALTQVPAGATLNLASGVYDVTGGEVFPIQILNDTTLLGAGLDQTRIVNSNPEKITIQILDGATTAEVRGLAIIGGIIGLAVSNVSRSLHLDSILVLGSQWQGVEVKDGEAHIRNSIFLSCTRGVQYTGFAPSSCIVEGSISAGHLDNGFNQDNDGFLALRSCLAVGNNQGFWATQGGAGPTGTISNFTSSRNRYGIGLGTGFGLEMTLGFKVTNSIMHENSIRGINEETSLDDPELRNVLFYNNGTNYFDEGSIPYNTEFEINNLVGNGTAPVENNIVADPLFLGGPTGTSTDVQYNSDSFQSILTDFSASWKPGKFQGAILYPHIEENTFAYYVVSNDTSTVTVWGDITDASFAATVVGATYEIVDYHLSRFSPAIDAGYDPAVEAADLDLDGNLRIAGEAVDIGAYEFGGCPPSPTPQPSWTPQETYTPYPTYTNPPTQTALPTYTFPATQTPLPTYTAPPSQTALPTYTPYPTPFYGDLNGDGKVDVTDQLLLLQNWYEDLGE
ncbi:MAG: DUF1565 domain-containing protein [Candidatus Omnitrophica bacterium]|nr:DUF1565 domain-containing protein [Candidatus Omnitrophota bacterium]